GQPSQTNDQNVKKEKSDKEYEALIGLLMKISMYFSEEKNEYSASDRPKDTSISIIVCSLKDS
ncbi:6413_t:CDS:2, partial [Funneliformis geosporum]